MTTLAALVAATPAAGRGQPVQIPAAAGVWRHVLELADPAAGASVEWFDITEFWCGYEYTRGADQYQGRYRASVANVELCTDTDALAPWNDDTSATFGVHVELGPGLLIRSGFIRVDGGVVVEWLPRFTNKVESWGDAAWSQGKIRRHLIVARDTLTSLATLPLPASSEENWSDRMFFWLTETAWPYGSVVYGAQFEADTTTPILLLPDRPAASSALNELDATLDPVGLVWYTNRLGQLAVRPRVDDTFHADAFDDGATGNEWPAQDPVVFGWYACADDETSSVASYAADNSTDPFGLDRTERALINHVKITYPAGGFDDDDPVSIARYDRKTLQASWIAANDTIAAAILGSRADATVEARPLHTGLGMPGFMPGPPALDYLFPVHVDHRNNDTGLSAYADGWVRQIREQCTPRGCELDWALTFTLDVYATSSDAGLLPVEDLTVEDVTASTAELSWTNPTQTITPTNTQIRLLSTSSIWGTVAYPITGTIWSSLAPSTVYTFQVRLIRVVDGVITHYSPARQVSFVTDPAAVPVIDDDTVIFPPPTPPCDEIDWELQSSVDGTTWVTVDSGTLTGEPWTVDLSGYTFDPVKAYRVEMDACGDVSYSDVFNNACTAPPILGDPPYDDPDLVAYWPGICPPDEIVEVLTETPAVHGPCFDTWVLDAASSVVLVANGDGNIVLGGNPPALSGLTGDATIAARVQLATQPDDPVVLFSAAALQIEAIPSGLKWSVRGKANEAGAGITSITGATELDFGAWYDITLVHDVAAGDLVLYIDGVNEVDALGTVGERNAATVFAIGNSDNGLITNCAVWDIVLITSTPEVTYDDDFSTTSGLWTHLSGTAATISGGNIHEGPSTGDSYTISTFSMPTGDYYFEADIHAVANSDVAILMRLDDANNWIKFWYHPATGAWIISKMVAGVFTTLTSVAGPAPGADPFRIRAEVEGSDLRLYQIIGGSPIMRAYASDGALSSITEVGIYFNHVGAGSASYLDNVAIGELMLTGLSPSGGTISTAGGYTYHTFTAPGLFDPAGLSLSCDYLVVGGGGGGSRGGGGAGGMRSGSTTISTPQTVAVGAGGAGGVFNSPGSNQHSTPGDGGNSSLGAIASCTGGGGAGAGQGGGSETGRNGGSGGGAGTDGVAGSYSGGTGTSGEGSNGGSQSFGTSSPYPSGGGGGKGAAGQNATSSSQSGAGGIGAEWPSGSGNYYAGGGGGGIFGSSSGFGLGGLGGGGAGGTNAANGTAGTTNKGGGGGGAGQNRNGGAGGSGIVIVRYPTP